MIRQALTLITQELEAYIASQANGEGPHVVPGNIGLSTTLGGTENYTNDRIVISLVNFMEEDTLRNSAPLRPANQLMEIEYPPVYLNLYLLFSANYTSTDTDVVAGVNQYGLGITRLTQVAEFFQTRKQFSLQNAPNDDLLAEPEAQDLCVNVELVSLSFEQINYLWGSLGGKQLPFLLYRAYVIPVTRRERIISRGGIVQEIQGNLTHLNP